MALVHVRATGVCGSDVHFWKHAGLGPWKIEHQCALGHESGGIVVAVGEGVDNVKPGDRVAIEPGVPCFKATCDYCRTGKYNLCPTVDFYSVPPKDGTLKRYHEHPAGWLHKVPDNMSYEEIALLEPLSVTLQATLQAEISLGTPVLITGAGPIGIVQLLCASAAGATPIVITDVVQDRLDFAQKIVPGTFTYKVDPKLSPLESATRSARSSRALRASTSPRARRTSSLLSPWSARVSNRPSKPPLTPPQPRDSSSSLVLVPTSSKSPLCI